MILFQEHFREYKRVAYHGVSGANIMFERQIDSSKRLNILYDDVVGHYHVIANLTASMARMYACKGCHKLCTSDVTHACDQTFSDCMSWPSCEFSNFRIPCLECNRHFRSHTCFANNKRSTKHKRTVCERKRCCGTCGWVLTLGNHKCNNLFCDNSKENKEIGHFC